MVARSFGAIYLRNAINAGMPVLVADLVQSGIRDGDEITVDLVTGGIELAGDRRIQGKPFSAVQMAIYQRGGLLGGGHG